MEAIEQRKLQINPSLENQSPPEGAHQTSQRTTESQQPSPSQVTCPICLEKLEKQKAILQCIHKYHTDCIADWLLECKDQDKEAVCTIDKVPVGEELIVNGATMTVRVLMQQRKKEKAKAVLKNPEPVQRLSNIPVEPVRRGRGRPRGSGRGGARGAIPRNRSRSRSRNGNRTEENLFRRDLAQTTRNRRNCVLCLRNDPTLTLVEKPCPGRICRSTVPQHLQCLQRLGNRNGSTDCYQCDKRRHPTDYRNEGDNDGEREEQEGSYDSELEGSSFHPGIESPSESISPSPEEGSDEAGGQASE